MCLFALLFPVIPWFLFGAMATVSLVLTVTLLIVVRKYRRLRSRSSKGLERLDSREGRLPENATIRSTAWADIISTRSEPTTRKVGSPRYSKTRTMSKGEGDSKKGKSNLGLWDASTSFRRSLSVDGLGVFPGVSYNKTVGVTASVLSGDSFDEDPIDDGSYANMSSGTANQHPGGLYHNTGILQTHNNPGQQQKHYVGRGIDLQGDRQTVRMSGYVPPSASQERFGRTRGMPGIYQNPQ